VIPGPPTKRRLRAPKFLLAVPSMVWYLLFFVIPIVYIIVYSFGTKDSTKLLPVDLSNLTLQNYRDVFDETFFTTFKGTLKIALIATGLTLAIGLPVAYFLVFKVREKWRAVILGLIVIPSFTSFLIRTLAWRIPLAPKGEFSKWLIDLGVIGSKGIQILETPTAVQIAIVYNYLGFMILPLFVALDRIESGMREASKDLGAGRVATFFGVTLPLAGPGIAAGVLLTFIPMCGDYVTATVLGGAKGNMIGAMIASQFSGAQNWPLGSAMAVLMIGAVLLTLAVGALCVWAVPKLLRLASPLWQQFRRNRYNARMRDVGSAEVATPSRFDWVKIAMGIWTLLVVVFMFIPILLVIRHSFNEGGSFTIWSGSYSTKWWGELFYADETISALVTFFAIVLVAAIIPRLIRRFTNIRGRWLGAIGPVGFFVAIVVVGTNTEWYRSIFKFAGIGDAMRNSFLAAFGATIIAVVIGAFAGTALARRPGSWTVVFMAVVFLILVTPEIMDAIALSGWFENGVWQGLFKHDRGPVTYGLLRLWVGQSLYASAVVTLIVRARLAGIDESLEQAAADLGAPPGRAFRQITLPLITSALVAGALLSFTLCLDNTIISALAGGNASTFPVALLGAVKSTIKPFWGVGAVVLFMVTMASLGFVASVLKKSGDSSSDIVATLGGG
jgi:spermidine/putrescine transport system permease protein